MLTGDFVALVRGRRIGKGKYVGYCPAHPDRNRSLSIAEGKQGILVKCMSAGCETRDVMEALGLRLRDLFYRSRDVDSAALKALYRQQHVDRLYAREQRMQDLKLWLRSLECKLKPVRTQNSFERDIDRFCHNHGSGVS